jgi:uncharacterized protein involved in response to NO
VKTNTLFALGFRPFYLLAALLAVIGMSLWLLSYTGTAQFGTYLQGVFWHSHEMLFGFLAAAMTGFLFTAVRNWTGLPTPTGVMLGVIALLWILARVLFLGGSTTLAVVLDLAFLPVVAAGVAIPILRSRNQRNYKILGILVALCALHFVFHLALAGELAAGLSRTSLLAAIDTIVILFAVVGGRVIPAFTRNAVPGSDPVHKQWLEVCAFGLLILIAAMTLLSGSIALAPWVPLTVLLLAAAAHALRLAYWQPQRTLNSPLLWMMPVAYSWLPLALLLRGLSSFAIVVPGTWIHALTAGALSSLIVAMMMRSTLGHTGRKLVASHADVAAFLLLQVAAILRVIAGISGNYRAVVLVSGVFWILAFCVFLLRYAPMLLRPRVDGRPG